MITAEQARGMTTESVWNLIMRTASLGKRKCELKLSLDGDYDHIAKELISSGFLVTCSHSSHMTTITW